VESTFLASNKKLYLAESRVKSTLSARYNFYQYGFKST